MIKIKNKIILSAVIASLLFQTIPSSFAEEFIDGSNSDVNNVEYVDSIETTDNIKATDNIEAADNIKTTDTIKTSDNNTVDQGSKLSSFLNDNSMTIRISSKDRVKTAIELSKFQNIKSEKVIFADAKNFPDALSASNLTIGKYPVLLVSKGMIPELEQEILRLEAKEAIILGGESSVSKEFEDSLKKVSGISKVTRLSGKNRYETNKFVYESSNKKKIVLTNGDIYPDALAASPLISGDYGLLLTKKDSLSSYIDELMKNNDVSPIMVGGAGSISTTLENTLYSGYDVSSAIRISDNNRYSTSTKIAERFQSNIAIITSGDSFPDALASSTLSQKINAPIILVSKDTMRTNVINYLKKNGIKKCIIIGGEGSISKVTADNIEKVLKGEEVVEAPPKPTYKINSIYAIASSDVRAYSYSTLKSNKFIIPKNKVIFVDENKGNVLKVRYNSSVGWVNADYFKNYDVNRIVSATKITPSPGLNWCAMWVSMVYRNAGLGYLGGNANDMYRKSTYTTDRSKLKPGMLVAVESSSTGTIMGTLYGHVGIYIGDGKVMDNVGNVRVISLDEWISIFCKHHPVRYGYPVPIQ